MPPLQTSAHTQGRRDAAVRIILAVNVEWWQGEGVGNHQELRPDALHKLGVGNVILDGLVDKKLGAVDENHKEDHECEEFPHHLQTVGGCRVRRHFSGICHFRGAGVTKRGFGVGREVVRQYKIASSAYC